MIGAGPPAATGAGAGGGRDRARAPLAALLAPLGLVLAGAGAWAAGQASARALVTVPLSPGSTERKVVVIEKGWGLPRIAAALDEEGILDPPWAFALLAKLGGKAGRLQAGEYDLAPSLSIQAILGKLSRGEVVRLTLTVPEGLTVAEVAGLVEKAGLGRRERFVALAGDPSFVRLAGVPAPHVEGYLFPDTYLFAKGVGEEAVLAAMVRRWRASFGEGEREAAARVGLDVVQAVTLASIIEKESRVPEERPLVSAVFHNRLRRGMPLQSDPTVIYGVPNFDGNLTRDHLATWTPYNTYRIPGLPPGPIANPGEASLHAAIHPAQVDYLYFVSRNDGTHEFSRTLEEHNRAVARYQLHRRGARRRPGGGGGPPPPSVDRDPPRARPSQAPREAE